MLAITHTNNGNRVFKETKTHTGILSRAKYALIGHPIMAYAFVMFVFPVVSLLILIISLAVIMFPISQLMGWPL